MPQPKKLMQPTFPVQTVRKMKAKLVKNAKRNQGLIKRLLLIKYFKKWRSLEMSPKTKQLWRWVKNTTQPNQRIWLSMTLIRSRIGKKFSMRINKWKSRLQVKLQFLNNTYVLQCSSNNRRRFKCEDKR